MRWLTRSLPFPQGRSLSFKTFLVWVLISIYQGKNRCSCSDACLLSATLLSPPSPTRSHIPVHLVITPPQLSARPFTMHLKTYLFLMKCKSRNTFISTYHSGSFQERQRDMRL